MEKHHPASVYQRRSYPLWRLIRANFYDLQLLLRESWVILAGFGLLALRHALYIHFFPPQLRLTAALYETLKLLSLQSSLPLPNDLLGQLLFFLLPLLGLALIFQSVLNFGRLLLDKSSRREAWQVALASTYSDHVIVCGLGRVSMRVVVQLLESGYNVIVIEREWGTEFVDRMLNLKVPVVLGDAREPAILRQAGLQRARAIVAGVNDDLINIEIALTARAERPDIRVVLRIFNEELDNNLERTFGRSSAFSASALAAPTFAAAAISREVDYVLSVAAGLLGVTHMTVQHDSSISGFVRELEQHEAVRVLHHEDQAGRHLSRGNMRQVSHGDRLTLLGPLHALEALHYHNIPGSRTRQLDRPHGPTEQLDTVIICGLGKVGYRVVRQLHQLTPRPRIVVVRTGEGRVDFPHHISQLDGVTTILGDARDITVLERAGLARAYSIAALTSDDLLNLQIGLTARRQRADLNVVLRVFSDALAEKLADMFGLRTIYSTSGLAGPTLAAAAILGDIDQAFFVGGRFFSADELTVQEGDLLAGQRVDAIRSQHDALVIGLRRAGLSCALPEPTALLAPGDEVTLLATLEALARLRAGPAPGAG